MASMDGSFQIVKEQKAKRCLPRDEIRLADSVCLLLSQRAVMVGGADRDRTGDPLLAKQVLSQLSYSPLLVLCERRTEALLRHDHGGSGKTRTSDLTLIRGAL